MPAPETDPLELVGTTLAHKYLVQELVDVGGFSVVYRAHHTVWRKPVAIKFFNALSLARSEQREALQEAFVREGALLADLSSRTTSIVQAWDVGTHVAASGEWMPYMVLEWLDGKPLDRIIDEEQEADAPRWTFEEVHAFLADAAAALELAHQQGIAHRDVKPANLFVAGDARAGGVVKILDFGIAKVMADRTLAAELATTGMSIRSFTPDYGAPEQFSRDYGATGPWTDVFGLALCAVELLTREPPLGGGEIVELAQVSTDPQARPTPGARGVPTPPAIEAVFRRALAVSPRERYATAGVFWRDLGEAIAGRAGVTLREFSIVPSPLDSSAEIRAMSASVAPRRSYAKLGAFGALGALALAGLAFVVTQRLWSNEALAKPPAALGAVSGMVLEAVGAAARDQCPAGMVKIPAGQFYMGSHEPSALPNEKPSFNVQLRAFCIDLTEVTVADYRACSERGACPRAGRDVHWPNITEAQKQVYGPECNDARDDRLDHPINCVSHAMAERFCEQRGRRLPTEAEWEYATRGPDGRVYPWGDDPPTPQHLNACGSECVAWGKQRDEPLTALYDASDGFPTTAPVGRFRAGRSRFGPYDVVGNVWEWVADWYADYTPDEKANPKGPASGERKVIRGGGWNGSYATWLRPSFRYAQDPAALSAGIGFRCALSLPRKP